MRFGDLLFDRAILCKSDALDGRYRAGETLLLVKGLSEKYRYAAVLEGDEARWIGLSSEAMGIIGERYSIIACCYSALCPTILYR